MFVFACLLIASSTVKAQAEGEWGPLLIPGEFLFRLSE
jgi:hypothetical protein